MKTQSNLKICVLVPTRNRPAILKLVLESLVSQSDDNFCVVVSDNSNEIEAQKNRAIVDTYASDIDIVLIKPEDSLSMSEHWNFIVGQAIEKVPDADYYSFLTDRLICHPEAISVLSKAATDADCPSIIMYQVAHLRHVNDSLVFKDLDYDVSSLTQIESKDVLRNFANGKRHVTCPRFLNSIMQRDALIELELKNNNVVFGGIAPDYYYTFLALAHFETYWSLDLPVTASIANDLSNGGNFTGFKPNEASRDFEKKVKSEQGEYLKIGPMPNELYLLHNVILREYLLRCQLEEGNVDILAKFPPINPKKLQRNSLRQLMEAQRDCDREILANSKMQLDNYIAQYPDLKTFLAIFSTKAWQAILWLRILRNRIKAHFRGNVNSDSNVDNYEGMVLEAIKIASNGSK